MKTIKVNLRILKNISCIKAFIIGNESSLALAISLNLLYIIILTRSTSSNSNNLGNLKSLNNYNSRVLSLDLLGLALNILSNGTQASRS